MKFKKQMIFLTLMAVSAIFIFVLGYQEEKRLTSLDRSFSELFNDRLIAESCVFKMNDLLHEKQALHLSQSTGQTDADFALAQQQLSKNLLAVYHEFQKTKLSSAEKVVSQKLFEHVKHMDELEKKTKSGENMTTELRRIYTSILALLENLSDIQVSEGTRLNNDGHKTLASAFIGLKLDTAVYVLFLASLFGLLRKTFIQVVVPARPGLN